MSDVFDIGGSAYSNQRKGNENYIHGRGNEWLPVETQKDPRLSRRDKEGSRYSSNESQHYRGQQRSHSPQHDARWRSPKTTSQMYNQHSQSQQYQSQVPPPPPPVYSEYNSGYGDSTTQYQHGYQQSFQQNSNNFGQYSQQGGYAAQASSSAQGYNSSHQHQPGPPGDDYPSSSWAPVVQQHRQDQLTTYPQMNHPEQPQVPPPSSVATSAQLDIPKTDDFKKEAAIANELKQQRATLIKQRDDYVRKSSVLRRELDKLRVQKQELVSEKSPARESQRILRENAKLQLEIQNKLKSIYNVIDMLSGIIGDGLKAADLENRASCNDNSPKQQQQQQQRSRKSSSRQPEHDSDSGSNNGVGSHQLLRAKAVRASSEKDEDQPRYNYVHYDPELHWCRICDVFPRTAKDLLTHLHSTEHRQVTQDHQLVDTPWHKLPADPELPSYKGAPAKRVPIKGLQFFISATAWYCKLCDIWIGDLHCASLHLKSKNHSHNYSNFVEQNPHWESNWLKDREKAYSRCAKAKQEAGSNAPFTQEVHVPNEKSKSKSRKNKGDFLESTKEKKRKKKTKKRKKAESSGSSSSSSSTSNSSSEDESDKAKSIRVAMRNKMRMQAQMILNEELGNKVEVLEKLLGERNRKKEDPKTTSLVAALTAPPPPPPPPDTAVEDNIINQWMTVSPAQDKQIFDHLKDRLKQRQKADEDKVAEAAAEQRRKDREREERELKELREREQKEIREKLKEKEQEELKAKEKEKNRRKRDSRSPDYHNNRRSRSRENSRGKRHFTSHSNDRYSAESPNEKYKPKAREYDEEESNFDKRYSESYKFKQNKNQDKDKDSKKLPFIGRMPLFKKKSDSGGSGTSEHSKSSSKKVKQDYQVRLSKFESGITARPFIPEPGVVHITKLATPQDTIQTMLINAENPPPPPKIIPEPPQISETAPSPPHINNVVTTVEEPDVQDMELDEAVALPPGVPVAEAKPIARPAGNHLPRDFQDALNIIYPGDQLPEHLAAHADPNLMLQYQYQYNMMYSNMQMQYDYTNINQEMEPEEETELMKEEDVVPPPPPDLDDKEDLAMLGIDAEDMAAQTF